MSPISNLSDFKPYLIKAAYDWIRDNGQTPLIVISTTYPGVEVPEEHRGERGDMSHRIVLNLSDGATVNLIFDFKTMAIYFVGRFSGRAHQIRVPIGAISSIFCRETSEGSFFQVDHGSAIAQEQADPVRTKPILKIVK